MNPIDLAPALMARVASWQEAVLSEMAAPALADEAVTASLSSSSWPGFASAYERAVAREQERLWGLTVDSTKFLAALAFAKPGLAERVMSHLPPARTSKSRRQLAATLYRYLSRGAGRCQPFGMWSGVSLVRWGATTQVTRSRPIVSVEPDLSPFYSVFRQLTATPGYRGLGLWQMNPTLAPRQDGSWTCWIGTPQGVATRRIRPDSRLPGMMDALSGCGPATFHELLAALVPFCRTEDSARSTLESCMAAGILVGGVQPPWRFCAPDEALEIMEHSLLARHRAPWRNATLACKAICRRLEETEGEITPREVLDANQSLANAIQLLHQALGQPCPDLPEALLRCDLKAPVEIQLSQDIRERLELTIREYLDFQGRYGFATVTRTALLARQFRSGSPRALNAAPASPSVAPSVSTWEELRRVVGGGEEFAHLISRWEELLNCPGERVVARGGSAGEGPPFGWLQASLSGEMGNPSITIHGLFDDLWGPYARHAVHWGGSGGDDPLAKWVQNHVQRIALECRIDLAELASPFWSNPNVLARPPLGIPAVSPWSCHPGALDLAGAALLLDADGSRALLAIPGRARPAAVLHASSAYVHAGDPLAELLLTTSLSMAPGASFSAAVLAFPCETGPAPHTSPKVALPSGTTVRTRRTVLDCGTVARWARMGASGRFAAWSHMARLHGWPHLVRIHREDGTAMVLHRDSTLGVAAALQGIRAGGLTVEHLEGQPWLACDGERFVAEMSIPFLRHRHIWSHLGAAGEKENADATGQG